MIHDVYLMTCDLRAASCWQTVERLLRQTDFFAASRALHIGSTAGHARTVKWGQRHSTRDLLLHALADGPELFLFLEDDVAFNAQLFANLAAWPPIVGHTRGEHLFASLYNPGLTPCTDTEPPEATESYRTSWHPARFPQEARAFETAFLADHRVAFGSQALVLSRATARYCVDRWDDTHKGTDLRLYSLASRITPLWFHRPSLVQHVQEASTCGSPSHAAADFRTDWRAA